ncbi:prephenate dehydratase [Pyrofollis japonicus]|uniref:prephenate dehydratase n=1 Tax=Pyrofollis japonicus TaxID=3060460 RepID=UPI00295B4F5F|nr:prephenate dehydratase domain-containing protein [Pyrofollis japonicus]
MTGKRVAFLGPRNSFTHIAAEELFHGYELVPARSVTEVFNRVENYEADYGVVPLENSLEGPVGETLHNLASTMLSIYAGIEMKIGLVLARSGDGAPKRLYTHPHAYGEAYHSVNKLLGTYEYVPTSSTSKAAEEAARNGGYCICSQRAASENKLEVVNNNIGPENNYTRFIVLAWHDQPRNASRTMIVAALPDQPGSLHYWLEPFATRNINLKMIYSMPAPGKPWHYNFYVELEGTRLDKNVAESLKEVHQRSLFLRVLGSYPYHKKT